jgi:uncharacterized protein YceK
MRPLVVLIATLLLGGCDKISSLIDTKAADAKAVGYSCRMANKLPNICMAENPKQPQSYILAGWQKADEEIKEGIADPEMKNQVVDADAEHSDKEDADK